MPSGREALLAVAFRHAVSAANVEEGFQRVRQLLVADLDYDTFRDALDLCLREGLIREPVRLPEGALQCHWRLELTPSGVAAARALPPRGGVR